MSRYEKMFHRLSQRNEGAFIPYIMLGDPTLEHCKALLLTLIEAGADALELGFPFSDPIADGPTIQKAHVRALKNQTTLENCWDLITYARKNHPDIPIGLLTYSNQVVAQGMDHFYQRAHEAGVDGVLVPDVPLLEYEPFFEAAQKHHIDPILIAPPNLPDERILQLAKLGRGFTYVVTRKGVTGADKEVFLAHDALLKKLKEAKAPPSVFGFGISRPEHVRAALKAGASGAISGSAVVGLIENQENDLSQLLREVARTIRLMKEATKNLG